MRRTGWLAVAAVVSVVVCPALATERHVPAEYGTIQAAIDASRNGDVVIVADGTYTGAGNRDVDFRGRAITVRSASGNPAKCIVDCEHSGRGFYFHSEETATSVVQGLTIQNGFTAGDGGGVYCLASDPSLIDCTIRDNAAGIGHYGGGVYCDESLVSLTRCTITGNVAGDGGGVACYYSFPRLTNCAIARNTASFGGGLYCFSDSGPDLINCTITSNNATDYGGAVYGTGCDSANPTLVNCVLWANTPQEIYATSDTAIRARYCDVRGGWSGTGNIDADPCFAFPEDFHLLPGSPCIDRGTNTPHYDVPLPADDLDGQPRLVDGDGNGAAVADIGAYEFNPATPTLGLSATEIVLSVQAASQTMAIRNSSLGTLAWTLEWTADWLRADPTSGESAGEADTLTLTADATGLAHGTYVATLWVNAVAAANVPRAVTVMLHVPSTLHVPGEYATIQAAINAATVPGDVVVVADGVYTGAGNKDLDFAGREITVRSASGDPNTCIIDCEGSGRGFYFHTRETAAAVVRGFTICNGLPLSTIWDHGSGGGVLCMSSSPTLADCTISGNTASGVPAFGGGVYCSGSRARLLNCTIRGNTAGSNGGGMYCHGYPPTVANCAIIGNSSARGGGLDISSSSATIANCTISGNSARIAGGGLALYDSSSPTITNTIVAFNTSGFEITGSSPTLGHNCVYGNAAYDYSGVADPTGTNGNISADPLFRSRNGADNDPNTIADNDYRLLSGSPCIDAGSNGAVPPDTLDLDADGNTTEPLPFDLAGRPRFVDDLDTPDCRWAPGTCGSAPIVDMGAYEFQPAPHLAGDLNCDGMVDYADINPFVLALSGQSAYEARYPDCRFLNSDINGDGVVSFADINPFVRLLAGR